MTGLEVLLAPLNGLLEFFQKDRHHVEDLSQKVEEKRQDALHALYSALTTTHKYIDAQPDGIDREKKIELSKLWADAAISSRTYFEDGEPWMMEKANYYLSKMEWPHERVVQAGIDLKTVEERINQLIKQ
jgi:hypothetical protein